MNIRQSSVRKFAKALGSKYKKLLNDGRAKMENIRDKQRGLFVNPLTELAMKEFKKNGGMFDGFALAESSVRCFLYHLIKRDMKSCHICEFGGGQSTLFWNILANHMNLAVTTYEHDPDWAQYLIGRVNAEKIRIHTCELMQTDDTGRRKIFDNPFRSREMWRDVSIEVELREYKNPALMNGFYNIQSGQFPDRKVDAIILDGPHGNGRSLCFPLFYDYIENETLILLDDYHHYPFLDDLGMLFRYEIFYKRNYSHSNKGWAVLKIVEKVWRDY